MNECVVKFVNPVTSETYKRTVSVPERVTTGSRAVEPLFSTPEGQACIDRFFELNGEVLKRATLEMCNRERSMIPKGER